MKNDKFEREFSNLITNVATMETSSILFIITIMTGELVRRDAQINLFDYQNDMTNIDEDKHNDRQ